MLLSKMMDAIKLVIPLLKSSLVVDCIIELTDSETKRVVAIEPSQVLDFNIKVGDPLSGGVAEAALRTRKRQFIEQDSSAFGKPYSAVANPVFDEGRLVGVLTVGYPTNEKERLQQMAETLFAFVQQFSVSMEQVSSSSEELTQSSTAVIEQTDKISERVGETAKIIDSVKNISKQTQILGINASIEAARVGIEGRGFAVVASEIQRLAVTTQDSAKSIESTLHAVQDVFKQVNLDIGQSFSLSQSQNEALQEMNQAVQKLSELADQLLQVSRSVQM